MPVILATQEAEFIRITVQSQPRQIVCETLSRKHTLQKKRTGGMSQVEGPESTTTFEYHKKKNLKVP
jgi:aspartate/tyrosine/aromatic aminotransferase